MLPPWKTQGFIVDLSESTPPLVLTTSVVFVLLCIIYFDAAIQVSSRSRGTTSYSLANCEQYYSRNLTQLHHQGNYRRSTDRRRSRPLTDVCSLSKARPDRILH